MKNLDVIEQEKQEQAEAEALLAEVSEEDQQPGPQTGEKDERMYTGEEVRQIVAAAAAQERVGVECREYLLRSYFGMETVSADLDKILRVLNPSSVDDLKARMEEVEALGDAGGPMVHHRCKDLPAYTQSRTEKLKQIFVGK